MEMAADASLTAALIDLFKKERINLVLETGTHLGLGSTRIIAEAFIAAGAAPDTFITIEANYNSYIQAKANLERFPFVKCVWGCSVDINQAVQFIERDDALHHHENYPDVYIDTFDNPAGFYTREVSGGSGKSGPEGEKFREGLLDRYVYLDEDDGTPLMVLDSAGGIGLLEFQIVKEHFESLSAPFFLLLDDIHHLKHFRSMLAIEADPRFTILARSTSWALMAYRPENQP